MRRCSSVTARRSRTAGAPVDTWNQNCSLSLFPHSGYVHISGAGSRSTACALDAMKLRRQGACPDLEDVACDSEGSSYEYDTLELETVLEEGSCSEETQESDSEVEADCALLEDNAEEGSAQACECSSSTQAGSSAQFAHAAESSSSSRREERRALGTLEGKNPCDVPGSSSSAWAEHQHAAASEQQAAPQHAAEVHSCWVCFEDGCCVSSSTEAEGPHPKAEGHADDQLLVPCTVCCGSLQYMHKRCLASWLSQSWLPNCPNCKNPLARSAMESVPAGRLLAMLLDGLQAACRQVEQLDRGSHTHTCPYHASLATKKQLFPQGCVVSFALGRSNGQVHVDLPCAYLSVTAVAQQVSAIANEVMQGALIDDAAVPPHTSTPAPPDPMAALSGVKLTISVVPPEHNMYSGCDDLLSGIAYATYVRPQDSSRPTDAAAGLATAAWGEGDVDEDWGDDSADALLLWQRLLRRRNGGTGGVDAPHPSPGLESFRGLFSDRFNDYYNGQSATDFYRPGRFSSYARYLAHGTSVSHDDWGASDSRWSSRWLERLQGEVQEERAPLLGATPWDTLHDMLAMRLDPLPATPIAPARPSERNAWARGQLQRPGQARALTADLQRALHGGGGRYANGPRGAQLQQHQQPRHQPSRRNQAQVHMQAGGRRRC